MDYKSATKQRFAELQPGRNGLLQAQWQLTDTRLADAVTLSVPPMHSIPIIFVPGIMGTNLCDLSGKPVWLLDSIKDVPVGLATKWASKNAGYRQRLLHPARTKVYARGNTPKGGNSSTGSHRDNFIKRGWGEVSEASYHKFLLWLDTKMNGERNPANWGDFASPKMQAPTSPVERLTAKLPPNLSMQMAGIPEHAEGSHLTEPVQSDELLRRSKFSFPVYAFGYNWLDSNKVAAVALQARIDQVIAENNVGPIKCTQVILVTHSMGGLVARACCQLAGMGQKILGVVHGVMPATGAAVAYRRCKVGMKDEDLLASLVIGVDGREVSAVFAQSPGALQLLPCEQYGSGWLELVGPDGESLLRLPKADPYAEIYLQRNKWWGLINEEWLAPGDGEPIDWSIFASNIKKAREFHRSIFGKYHHNTFVFYGGGKERTSFTGIRWTIRKGRQPKMGLSPTPADILNFGHAQTRTDGSNAIYVGGGRELIPTTHETAHVVETSHWEVRAASVDSAGDGTVPKCSGEAPRRDGGKQVLQQFELSGIKHEPAYRDDMTARQVAYYAITKLAAMAVSK